MFEDDIWDIKLRNTIIYLELKKIFETLNKHNYAVIKGEPLSFYAYNKNGCRNSTDIDILVPRSDISAWETILKENSMRPLVFDNERMDRIFRLSLSHQLAPYVNDSKTFSVDLNFDLFWGEYEGERIDISEFLSDPIEMEIYGVKIKTLTPIKTLLQISLHHYKDMNSIYLLSTHNSIKYDAFKDVYYLLKNHVNEISIEELYLLSERYKVLPYVFYILYYTKKIFEDKQLCDYINELRTPEGEMLLNCYGLSSMERKEWKYDFETRLECINQFDLIKDDLTESDMRKIEINKHIFMGEIS